MNTWVYPGESVVPCIHPFSRNYTHNLTRSHGIILLFLPQDTTKQQEHTHAKTHTNLQASTNAPAGPHVKTWMCRRASICRSAYTYAQACTFAQAARKHTSLHRCSRTGTHALEFACANAQAHMHASLHEQMRTYVYVSTHAKATRTPSRKLASELTQTHGNARTHLCVGAHTHTRWHTRSRRHTHSCANTLHD